MRHAKDLYPIYGPDSTLEDWSPLPNQAAFDVFLEKNCQSQAPYYLATIDKESRKAVGSFALIGSSLLIVSIALGSLIFLNRAPKTVVLT